MSCDVFFRTNLPKEVMAFPDFPFREELPSFMSHDQVCGYLQDYVEHFQLNQHIKVKRSQRSFCLASSFDVLFL